MSTFSQFHTWATGETITAALLNGEISSIVTAGNNIDNNNIGAAGVFASQLVPTSPAQATFGGAQLYEFLHGLAVLPGADGVTPLAVVGNSVTQSSPLLSVSQSLGGTLEFQIGANGLGTINAPLAFTNSGTVTSPTTPNIAATATADSLVVNVPTASPAGMDFQVNGVSQAGFDASGSVQGTVHGQTQKTFLMPMYTRTGGAVANTVHGAMGSVLVNAGASVTVTLSGAAVFTSAATYGVNAVTVDNGGVGVIPASVGIHSGTQFILTNTTGANNTYFWVAMGT